MSTTFTNDPAAPRNPHSARLFHSVAFVAFVICAAAMFASLLPVPFLQNSRWPEILLPVTAFAITLFSLARALPAQNVLLVSTLIILLSGLVQIIDAKIGIPFGSLFYHDNAGLQLPGGLPWPIPLIWTVVILNSRGVARLIMRPWRKTGKYGFWVIGLACALTVIFDLGLEPFATHVRHYWDWQVPAHLPVWYTAPIVNFLGWAVTTLLILAFTTPWLINKKPARQLPPDYHPLVIWLVLNLLLATGSATHQLWWAVAFTIVTSAATAFFAMKGARW